MFTFSIFVAPNNKVKRVAIRCTLAHAQWLIEIGRVETGIYVEPNHFTYL